MISLPRVIPTMLFLSSQFAQTALRSFPTLWNQDPLTEPEIQLLQPENQIAIRFYDYIRLRRGKEISLLDLVDIGIPIDNIFELFLLIYLQQGQDSIRLFQNSEIAYIVYKGSEELVS